jgi:hypothetical protein
MRNDSTETFSLWISILTLLVMGGLVASALPACASATSSPQAFDGGACRPSSGPMPPGCLTTKGRTLYGRGTRATKAYHLNKFEKLCITLEYASKLLYGGPVGKEIREGLEACYWVYSNNDNNRN